MEEFYKKTEHEFTQKMAAYLKINKEIISKEGLVEVIAHYYLKRRPTDREYKKDFLLFCITKFSKTLKAIMLLLENDLNEDALILTRSNYEIMLHTKALAKKNEVVNHFIQYKLGLENEKYYHYKKGNKGKRIWNIIIDNDNPDNEIQYINEIKQIARHANEVDSYKNIYKFLCEVSHCNFLTSGYYRDNIHYDIQNGLSGAKINALVLNIGISLKMFEAYVESGLLGEYFENVEHILNSLLKKDKLILPKWFEEEKNYINDLVLEGDLDRELATE